MMGRVQQCCVCVYSNRQVSGTDVLLIHLLYIQCRVKKIEIIITYSAFKALNVLYGIVEPKNQPQMI